MRTLLEVAEIVIQVCKDAGLERVRNPVNNKECDENGVVCRVCLLYAPQHVRDKGHINGSECLALIDAIVGESDGRDFGFLCAERMPHGDAFWEFIRDAAKNVKVQE